MKRVLDQSLRQTCEPVVYGERRTGELMGAGRLVGLGFRGWLAGLERADIGCMETVWNNYRTVLGPDAARPAVERLARWVASVRRGACRRICVADADAVRFCQDECMAVSIIAAAQNDTCPAMRACAFALLGSCEVDPMVAEAEGFAGMLKAAGQIVSPVMISNAAGVVAPCRSQLPN